MTTAQARRWVFQPWQELKRLARKYVLLPLDKDVQLRPSMDVQEKEYQDYLKRGCK